MVNSNFYGMDLFKVRPSSNQAARAATLIQGECNLANLDCIIRKLAEFLVH